MWLAPTFKQALSLMTDPKGTNGVQPPHTVLGFYVVGAEARRVRDSHLPRRRVWLKMWRERGSTNTPGQRVIYVIRHDWVEDRDQASAFTYADAQDQLHGPWNWRNLWTETAGPENLIFNYRR